MEPDSFNLISMYNFMKYLSSYCFFKLCDHLLIDLFCCVW